VQLPTDPDFAAVEAAAKRIQPYIRQTPVLAGDGKLAGMTFKCENLQVVGAFKARGACNAVFSLTDEVAARGVVTHSSGNHAAALARAARLRGIPASIVMPAGAPLIKRAAVQQWGGSITECEPTLASREAAAAAICEKTGASLIHPYDDPDVIAGQGTAVLELTAQMDPPDVVLVPVGGGGLLTGSALVVRQRWPKTRIIGVEPELADDAAESWRSGVLQPQRPPLTIADGLRGALSARTLRLARRDVDDLITVSEEAIIQATRLLFEQLKVVVEPSAAVPLAAVRDGRIQAKRIALLLSGGNVDLDRLPWG
jgi:threonine dehydratase